MQSTSYLTRPYRGPSDLPGLVEVINARMDAEGGEDHTTVAKMAQQYEHLTNCDPHTDILVAEERGTIVGYGRTTWRDVAEGYRQYYVVVETHPDHPELRDDLYDWVEARAGEIAATHPRGDKYLTMWSDESLSRADVLRRRGYTPLRYGAEMVRPHLDDIPERRLPEGVERCPVEESHLRAIWEAEGEAFQDAWGYAEPTEEDWKAWRDDPNWDPSLWQVAWAEDRVVGQVRTYIDRAENTRFDRLRGYTENISTAREWRNRGIASALICSSLRVLKEAGMTEAALGVDSDSKTGAQRLYRSLGYVQTRREALYRRPIEEA